MSDESELERVIRERDEARAVIDSTYEILSTPTLTPLWERILMGAVNTVAVVAVLGFILFLLTR